MTKNLPTIEYDDLPPSIPMFPLPSALLLPGGHLPLNIFEARYLAMVDTALASPTRLIGMVQPTEDDQISQSQSQLVPGLFSIGCAGRITYFQETEDQRYVIALTGVSRFRLLDQRLHVDAGKRVFLILMRWSNLGMGQFALAYPAACLHESVWFALRVCFPSPQNQSDNLSDSLNIVSKRLLK